MTTPIPRDPMEHATGADAPGVSKHTPGPWVARIQRNKQGRDLGWIIEHENGRIGWASLAYEDTNSEAEEDDPARSANALLIAAAPELLEALKDCAHWLDSHGCSASFDPHKIALAAIAKAEGAAS